jgi:hypothetical protein
MKRVALLAVLLGVAACDFLQPPQSHVTADGRACHPIGYSWAPIWVTPDGSRTC